MRRLVLISAGVPAGLITGLAAWLAAGGPSAATDKLAPVEAQLSSLQVQRPPAAPGRQIIISDLAATPLFALSVGPSAVRPPLVRLEGVSRSARRTAALLSIDGRPSQWLALGETRDGVTLQTVGVAQASVDTVLGEVTVELGRSVGGEPQSGDDPQAGSGVVDRPPQGFRSPPPPASAPGLR